MIDLSKFANPAFHFSGGKDSLACLYLLRPQLHSLTVYWLNTQDGCPETLAVIEQVREWIPNFVEVKSDSKAWREQFGHPSDLVPANSHFLGQAYGLSKLKMTPRFDCCHENLMRPMHERMLADKVDCVIRGTKTSDTGKVPAEGSTPFYEIILPIRDWTHEQVFAYLEEVSAPRNAIYEHFKGMSAPECFSCSAWWGDGKASYLKTRHPEAFSAYQAKIIAIAQELRAPLMELESELSCQ